MDFWRAISVLEKRKWLICLCVVVSGLGAFAASQLLGGHWAATIRLVSSAKGVPAADPDPEPSGPSAMAAAKEEAEVYEALAVSKGVLQTSLAESEHPPLRTQPTDVIRVKAVSPRLFELQVIDATASQAAGLANALAKNLVEQNHSLDTQEAQRAVTLLEDQLQEVDGKLASTRRDMEAFRRERQIVASVNEEFGPAVTRLQAVRQQHDEAVQKLAAAEARLAERQSELSTMPMSIAQARPVSEAPLVKQLEEELAAAERQVTVLRVKYTDEKSEVKQAMATRDALQDRLSTELKKAPQQTLVPNPEALPVRRAVLDLRQEVRGARAQLAAAQASLVKAQAEVSRFSGVDGPLAKWNADLSQLTEARGHLVTRLQAARMALDSAGRQGQLAMLDPVSSFNPPQNITQGRTIKITLAALLGALIISCGLVLLLDSVDRRVRTVGEAELALPVPVIAAIPDQLGPGSGASGGGGGLLARVTELQPQSIHSEAYHFLAMHLLRHRAEGLRALMVVSAKAGQGATDTICNLGIALAQAGHSVLLVDANLRSPSLHKVFELENDRGFTTLLRDPEHEPIEWHVHPGPVAQLGVMTSGPACDNPWQLLCSRNVDIVSRRLRDAAEFVLFDTPAALPFTDALNLAPGVDAAVLCLRALEPTSGTEERLVQLLEEGGIRVLGSVLSDVPAGSLESFQNYQRYFPSAPVSALPVRAGEALPVSAQSRWVPAESNGAE